MRKLKIFQQMIRCVLFSLWFLSVLPGRSDSHLLPAGSGFGTLSFGEDGSLAQLYSDDSNLYFRRRDVANEWTAPEKVIPSFVSSSLDASLLYVDRGSGGRWEVAIFRSSGLSLYRRVSPGNWSLIDGVSFTGNLGSDFHFDPLMDATLGPGGIIYAICLVDDDSDIPHLIASQFDGVQWTSGKTVYTFTNRTKLEAFDSPHQFRDPRMLSIAVDSTSRIHLTVSANQISEPVAGGTRVQSDLYYFESLAGNWSGSQLLLPGGTHHDGGIGASIAIAPDDTVAVAATFLPRAPTGSPGRAELRYLVRQQGQWSSELIANSADGYFSRDGQQGTGLYPHLRFDRYSRPHVVFTDHASEHVGTAWSYSGQLRYGVRNMASGTWDLQTLVSQPTQDAFLRRLERPILGASIYEDQIAIFAEIQENQENPFQEIFSNYFMKTGPWENHPFTVVSEGRLRHNNLGTGAFEVYGFRLMFSSESIGSRFENNAGEISSRELGTIDYLGVPVGWCYSSRFGWTHFGEDENSYGGWINTERFDWMKFETSGQSTFLWVPMMNSWMTVNGDGSFYSFQWGQLTPEGLNRYQSSIFGPLTTGDFGGWVYSDSFGWMWTVGDGIWFWSETRQEWLGVTADGGVWSTQEERFL